jgi:hypothetical protein
MQQAAVDHDARNARSTRTVVDPRRRDGDRA